MRYLEGTEPTDGGTLIPGADQDPLDPGSSGDDAGTDSGG